ncbi:hypothetical protein N431DRAFT_457482 [Stipitochalara longipes BDJ]|nr:hypothetical protein N431DRAFT_457482 [Stipitochalara longipes BDJ]
MPSTTMKVACCAIILFCLFQVLTSAPGRIEHRAKPPHSASANDLDSFFIQAAVQVANGQQHRIEATLKAQYSTESTMKAPPLNSPNSPLALASLEDLMRYAARKDMECIQHTARSTVPWMAKSTSSSIPSNPSSCLCDLARDQPPPRTLTRLHPLHVAVHDPIALE